MDAKTDWYSPAGAARLLGLTPQRVRQLMAEGRLHHIWTPNGRLIPGDEVARLQAERRAAEERGHDAANAVTGRAGLHEVGMEEK